MTASGRGNWVQNLSPELFWDVQQDTVSGEAHLRWLIERVLTYGRARDWSLLISNVSKSRISDLAADLKVPERERIFLNNYLEIRHVAH